MSEQFSFTVPNSGTRVSITEAPVYYAEAVGTEAVQAQPPVETTVEADLTDPILFVPTLVIAGLTAFAVRATTPKQRN